MKEFLIKNFGGVVGGLIGLIFAVLLVTIGFWKTLVILIFVAIGAFLGSNKSIRRIFSEIIDKITGKRDLK